MQEVYQTSQTTTVAQTNKVLKNTYMLLAMTLLASAVSCGVAMSLNMGFGLAMVFNIIALILVWFVLPRTANTEKGIYVVFAFTMLLGASLGPTINYYLQIPNGSTIVMQSMLGTALVFFGLSGYVLKTGKDFTFMGGFLMTGMILVIVAMLGMLVASFMGVDVSTASLAMSGVIVLLMSGMILYDTSRIINGGETNYIMATVSLYLNIYNMFVSLLHLLGALSGDE